VVVSMLFGGALREVAHHAHGYGSGLSPGSSPAYFGPATTLSVVQDFFGPSLSPARFLS
jgi:hypothetical protein